MNSEEAAAKMAAHFAEHKCNTETCDVAFTHYKDYLVTLAAKHGCHPQEFPSVRKWMRAHGQEPIFSPELARPR